MSDFHEFMTRHGEFGVQNLIERLERYAGVKSDVPLPLEQRWAGVMQLTETPDQQPTFAPV